jgi:replicative DNA helicase
MLHLFNKEAEENIIGSILVDPESLNFIENMISADDFYLSSNKIIFKSLVDLRNKNLPIDLIILQEELRKQNLFNQSLMDNLVEVLNNTISSANIEQHAKIVLERAKTRKFLTLFKDKIDKISSGSHESIDQSLDESMEQIFNLIKGDSSKNLVDGYETHNQFLSLLDEISHQNQTESKIKTGFFDLDRDLSSFKGGSLIVIAGRPSMGKTAFALNIFVNTIKQNKVGVFFSYEMDRLELYSRLASNLSEKPVKISSKSEADAAIANTVSVTAKINHDHIFINDNGSTTFADIRSQCRRLKAKKGLDLVVIDYLQLIPVIHSRKESREREVAELSRSLKALAKELNVPVIALCQLNRSVDGRVDKRPLMSDLRESGAIEQDADLILMLYRDEYYEKDNANNKGQAEVLISKQRSGPTGSVKLSFKPEICKFYDGF